MLVKTSELTERALDWAVAKCEGRHELAPIWVDDDLFGNHIQRPYSPSTDWAQGGPIIEREHMEFDYDEGRQTFLAADGTYVGQGKTHLIAAMRCYVASKLGDTVDIPEELL